MSLASGHERLRMAVGEQRKFRSARLPKCPGTAKFYNLRRLMLALALGMALPHAALAQVADGVYQVTGIDVDVTAASAAEARDEAMRAKISPIATMTIG